MEISKIAVEEWFANSGSYLLKWILHIGLNHVQITGGIKKMAHPLVEQAVNMAPFYQDTYTEDTSILVADTEKVLVYLPGKKIDLNITVGTRIDEMKGSVTHEAFITGKTVRAEKDRTMYGVPYVATAKIIQDESLKVVGIITAIVSNERLDTLRSNASELALMVEESEKRYRRLVELSPIAMLVHHDGLVQYANHACVKLLGASSVEELIGITILDFSVPEYKELVQNRIQKLNQTGVLVETVEEKVIRLDGDIIDVEVRGISIEYGRHLSYLMMIQDITAEKRAKEALRESEEKYRLIADNMTDLIGIWDVNGFVQYASPSHKNVLGFIPKAYEGHLAFDMVHPDDILHVQSEFMEMVMTKQNKVIEFRYKHINDYWVWVEAKETPVLDENGNILYFQVVARDITERKMYEEKLAYFAFHDALTGLPNRRLFKEQFKQAIKKAERYGRKMALMYMDLDKFKSINDSLGHDVGDELLKQFGQRVKDCLRDSDILARLGGDEFTVLLPEIELEQDAAEVADRILASIRQPWRIREYTFETTSSIGIVCYPVDGTTRQKLIEHADQAMYRAKENGRNTFKTYSASDGGEHQECES